MTPEEAAKKYEKAAKTLDTWIKIGVGDYAHDFIPYVQQNYLHGQALKRLTGETEESVNTWYSKRKKTWFVRPGIGIAGSLNYLGKWVGTSKEFMRPAFAAFSASNDLEKKIAEKIKRNLEK